MRALSMNQQIQYILYNMNEQKPTLMALNVIT